MGTYRGSTQYYRAVAAVGSMPISRYIRWHKYAGLCPALHIRARLACGSVVQLVFNSTD
ncbi:hypothetical protein [Mucilaginibacter ginsenosidivorans]|uniref:hypothetical protein n=1 Tax=Mucilaginibacter ginsenosidivorans TaxID=398053 RepID=UPI001652308D|nr:hypothetical protein [Mucilaginibacter ginsenosidivorans]